MSRIYLLRHARAGWPKPGMDDFNRPLNEDGVEAINQLGSIMLSHKLRPELILCSKARRTRESLQNLLPWLDPAPPVSEDETLYTSAARGYFDAIHHAASTHDIKTIMLIGHNPSMEDLALALCKPNASDAYRLLRGGFPTAGLAIIDFTTPLRSIELGKGQLIAFPKPE